MSSRMLETVGVVIALVLGAIALILGIVSLNRSPGRISVTTNGQGANETEARGDRDPRIWLFGIGHAGTNYEYVDDTTGEVRGFNVDLITAVCRIANKNCELVFDSYQRCWDSQKGTRPQGGKGLFGSYYDACTGWAQAFDRLRTFKFTDPYTEPFAAVFTVKPGNPSGFNWRDLAGRTIGFIDGFSYNEYCIAREPRITGSTLSEDQYIHYATRDQLYEAVNNGDVDAAFDARSSPLTSSLEVISEDITVCAKAGQSFMMRKDNSLDEWWNPAFAKLTATSEFRDICNGLKDQHGHMPGPEPVGYCIGIK